MSGSFQIPGARMTAPAWAGGSGGNFNGQLAAGFQFLANDGSAAAPGYSFASHTDAGMWLVGPSTLGFAVGGGDRFRLDTGTAAFGGIQVGLGSTTAVPDTILARDAANTLALRNGVNAQRINFYETYTDSSNYSRLTVNFGGGAFNIGAEAAGTGTVRTINFQISGGIQWSINTAGYLTGAAAKPIITAATTVAGLPAAAVGAGARSFVTDATVAAAGNFGAVVAGGGANKVPVYSDGTNWLVG